MPFRQLAINSEIYSLPLAFVKMNENGGIQPFETIYKWAIRDTANSSIKMLNDCLGHQENKSKENRGTGYVNTTTLLLKCLIFYRIAFVIFQINKKNQTFCVKLFFLIKNLHLLMKVLMGTNLMVYLPSTN